MILRLLLLTLALAPMLVGCGRPAESSAGALGQRDVSIASDAELRAFAEDAVRSMLGRESPRVSAERLAAIESEAGDRWPEALLEVARELHARPGAVQMIASSGAETSDPFVARLLERPAGRLDDALLDVVRDRELSREMRGLALAALCRPESADSVEALVDVALDASEDPGLREAVLLRLPRFRCALPERLDELLYLPFHGLDEGAALVLAACDRPVAVSLVLDAARDVARSKHAPAGRSDLIRALADVALRLAPDDAEAQTAHRTIVVESLPDARDARRAVVRALERWLAGHSEVSDTSFERDRRVARERATAALAAAPGRVTDLVGLPDADIDLAVAALVASGGAEIVTLERFERLLLLLERDVADAHGPAAKLAVLRSRLHGPRRRLSGVGVDGRASELSAVLWLQHGNCLGFTVLWTAVGERLGLPIRPMAMPGHVAIVWSDDDGDIILETTDAATPRPPEHYRTLEPLAVRRGDSGDALLRRISETELLAALCGNVAAEILEGVERGRWKRPQVEIERARDLARDALVLAPHDVNALVNLALATEASGKGGAAEALALLSSASARDDLVPLDRLMLARAYAECGDGVTARRLLAPVAERFSDDARVKTLQILVGE